MATQPLTDARALLALDALGEDRFRARRNLANLSSPTFGGQALGQALAAAQRTAPDWPANSLSGFFLRPGDPDAPMEFTVERTQDGRRFAVRRVSVRQGNRLMFDATCSFHDEEPGVRHQLVELGVVPPPESLAAPGAFADANANRLPKWTAQILRDFPVEIRFCDPEDVFAPRTEAARDFWCRLPSADPVMAAADHQALLALLSDYWLPGSIALPHPQDGTRRPPNSLSHTLWFHAPARADEWLLYRTDSHWADHGRGLARGLLFARDGRLVATVMQEALLRAR